MKKEQLLSRDNFRESVFNRDKHKCVFCDETEKLVAHHITERRLFTQDNELGGYFISNGVTVCNKHHLMCESTEISTQEVRDKCGIINVILPEHFYHDLVYDKWGNILQSNGTRLKGELFNDESVQKIIKPYLSSFIDYVKYPRTLHLHWTKCVNKDDKVLTDDLQFLNKNVVVSCKMDGENCLDGDSLISTPSGHISIKEICENKEIGLKLYSFNPISKELELDAVENVHINNILKEWYEIELEDGTVLKITGEHKIFVKNLNIYKKVKDLELTDELLCLS